MSNDESFQERTEDIQEERGRDDNADQDAQNNIHQGNAAEQGLTNSQKKALAVIIGGYVLAALVVATQPQDEPAVTFLVGGAFYGAIGWVIFTKEGRKWVMRAVESAQEMGEQQQQQSSESGNRKIICQECGWRNPKSNNYCHDCGDKLSG